MSRVFGGFEMANEVAAARESLLAKLRDRVQTTEYGISDRNGGGGKVGFIHGALEKGTGGQDHLPRTGTQG
jgi:hypothetical protein